MKIAVSVETTSDLSVELLSQYDIKCIPFQISIGDQVFKDGEITTAEIFARAEKLRTLPKTTALNQFEYAEYFENLLKDHDAVIHISLSTGLSSSCNNAFAAAQEVGNVYVVDSKSLSTGIGLLALYARKLVDLGFEASEVQKKVQERTAHLQVSFVVERLDYLYKGGRCNALSYFGANLLRIRPRIVVKNGKMGSDKKYRGHMGKVITKYCQDVLEEFNTPDLDTVFITYTSATEEMIASAVDACKEAGFKNIYQTFAGGTIASHCGANTLGILYFNDGGKK